MKHLEKIKREYEKVCQEYINEFCNKQDLSFEGWVANDVGSVACFGDMLCFSFRDIVWDINSKQPPHLIVDWFWESVDNTIGAVNYYSYSKGLDINLNKKRHKNTF